MKPLAPLLPLLLLLGGCSDVITDTFTYGTVEVRAERRDGSPVAGTEVVLFTGQRVMDVDTTGGDGVHRFDFVPFGTYGVFATPPEGYERPEVLLGGGDTSVKAGLRIEEGDAAEVGFVYLKRGPGRVEAVAREPDGTPVQDVPMTLFGPQGLILGRDTTDADGAVVFEEVPFGMYGVFAVPPPFYREEQDVPRRVRDGLLIEDGVEATAVFELERCEGTITARVLDPGGDPVPGKVVEVFRPSGVVGEGPTGPDGEVTFGPLLCRDHGLRLRVQPGFLFDEGRGSSFFDGIAVTRGFEETFTFTVEPCSGAIEVRVQDEAGGAVQGAAVDLFTGTGVVERIGSSAEGRAVFDAVPCGPQYGVRVATPDGFTVDEGRGSSFFDGIAVDPDDPVELVFTLRRVAGAR